MAVDETSITWSAKEVVARIEQRIEALQTRMDTKLDAVATRLGRLEEFAAAERVASEAHLGEHRVVDRRISRLSRRADEHRAAIDALADKEQVEEAATSALQAARARMVDWRHWAVGALLAAALVATSIVALIH